jgi:AcrR family transcriptional regulator
LVNEGYERTTTNRIAEVAGVSVGSVYHYFQDKAALVSTLVERHLRRRVDQLTAATRDLVTESVTDAVRTYVRALLAVHALEPEMHRVLIQEMPRLLGAERLRIFNSECEQLVSDYLEHHRQQLRVKNLKLAAFILVTCVAAVANAAALERRSLGSEELVDALSDLVLRFVLDR